MTLQTISTVNLCEWSKNLTGRERERMHERMRIGDIILVVQNENETATYHCYKSMWRDITYTDGKHIYKPRRYTASDNYDKTEVQIGWTCQRIDREAGFRFRSEDEFNTETNNAIHLITVKDESEICVYPPRKWRSKVPPEVEEIEGCLLLSLRSGSRWFLAAPSVDLKDGSQPQLMNKDSTIAATGYNCYRIDILEGFRYQESTTVAKLRGMSDASSFYL